ncbi:alanine--tRNA ligase, partial [Candidatus Peregrinibacteria bacterium]|nr:alanine--tRNA ligase [Candidatus Peregrinibacteria bacterium]
MLAKEIRQRFIDFFVKEYGHRHIASASVIPENDPTVLFTTAGMQQLVPYMIGEAHPEGKKLVDFQKCIRTDDIDEVGDATHLTFFEMLGNWSLGDYFKEEAIKMSYQFLTNPVEKGGMGFDPERLCVSCFAGDEDAPRDDEAAEIWESLGFVRAEKASEDQKKRIYFYGKEQNWWGPAGQTGPCGPDTEIFYDIQGGPISSDEHPDDESGRFVEIWNNVFMQYNKQSDGSFLPLAQKNVDTGMGLERMASIMETKDSPFDTSLFATAKSKLREMASEPNENSLRIILDHIRAGVFILGDPMGVSPSNTDQGYILRRLIRRAIRHARKIGIESDFGAEIAKIFINEYKDVYPELDKNRDRILEELHNEEIKFNKTLENGLREMKKLFSSWDAENFDVQKAAEQAFFIYETYGFPVEMIIEELNREGFEFDSKRFVEIFDQKFKKHQEQS